MSDSDKPKTEGRPESPTTARELDFDDDEPASHPQTPAKDSAAAAKSPTNPTPSSGGTATAAAPPPAQPPRPMSPREQAESTLREAFPTIEASVVRAVLAASGGQVEPAFHALLGMTDPDSAAQNEPASVLRPPPGPPPPQQRIQAGRGGAGGGAGPRSQLEADELYARQLAEHYQRQDFNAGQRVQQARGRRTEEEEERERNFIDDDLPEIGENIRKGFLETQQKFNGWLTSLKKKMDGDEDEPPQLPARRQAGGQNAARRSNDLYDADPEEFGNDFSQRLELRDDEDQAPRQPPRRANPDLFKPTPPAPQDGRRVSFQEGPPEEIGVSTEPSKTAGNTKTTSTTKPSKWQPLSSVDPDPVSEHDPFSLGDSDDEEAKKKKDGGDKKGNDNGLEKATAEAMAGEIGDKSGGSKLEMKDNTAEKK